jgi:hypothetical protein
MQTALHAVTVDLLPNLQRSILFLRHFPLRYLMIMRAPTLKKILKAMVISPVTFLKLMMNIFHMMILESNMKMKVTLNKLSRELVLRLYI